MTKTNIVSRCRICREKPLQKHCHISLKKNKDVTITLIDKHPTNIHDRITRGCWDVLEPDVIQDDLADKNLRIVLKTST